MTAAALNGSSHSAGWWTLLLMLAWFGGAHAIVGTLCLVGVLYRRFMDWLFPVKARPGKVPDEVVRSFREPMRDEWGNPCSGVSDEQLERLYAMDAREPRR